MILLQHVPCNEIREGAKAGHTDRLTLEPSDARDRRRSEKRSLSLVVLATDHDEIGARDVGIDDSTSRRIYNVDVPTEQGLNRLSTRTDVEKLQIYAVFPV